MADTKTSALPAGTTPAGTEVLPAVQGGANVRFTVDQIALKSKTLAQLNTQVSDATIARTDAAQVFTGAQYTGVTTLTYAATIAVDAALHNAFKVTLTGAAILGNPTNAVEGMSWTVRVTQDATGSRALTFDTNYTVPTAISTASDAANSERLLTCVALSATKIVVLDSLGAAV